MPLRDTKACSIDMQSITKKFDGKSVFFERNFSFPNGSISAIMGPSGSGKTTLLRILLGLETYEGRITGLDRSKALSVIFQENRLLPWLTALENVMLVLKGRSEAENKARAMEALATVELQDWADHGPDDLSGGMQRRVAMARAIAGDGELFIMDEPFTGLDSELRLRLSNRLMEHLRAGGKTVIFVTHDINEAEMFADNIVKL